jgi:hypothetical protein
MGTKLLLKSVVFVGCSVAALCAAGQVFAADTIQVQFGSYGYAGERSKPVDQIKKLCEGKPACEVPVNNDALGGDPSPGNDKGLMIGWKCGEAAHKEQFPEGKVAKLSCE